MSNKKKRFILPEEEIPQYWYNIQADMVNKPMPPLHPGTKQPLKAEDLYPIFAEELCRQELNQTDTWIEIPEEVREMYKYYRSTPLVRAYGLEKALGTPAHIYFKNVNSIRNNAITFGVGPAGTGKTYLAVAMAVKAFKAKDVSRIVLTRPAVEAGEKLGFLPGDLQQKVDPYLRPLYDGLFDMLGAETYERLVEKQIIEVAPLAYMRGRTLDDSFIILDEAQNTTPEQMKMFLTRMGVGSKVVVTGDVTQIDLPDRTRSGLVDALQVLKGVNGIAQCYFTEKDVVRHRLVQEIIKAYEAAAHPAKH